MFHLLSGRRSIQTLHDARLFALDQFYGIHPHLSKKSFDQRISELVRQKLLIPVSGSVCKPDASALHCLENNKNVSLSYFNGLKYYESGPIFLNRLLLLIQTLANSKKGYFSFIPVIDKTDITLWVKQFYKRLKPFEHQILPALYDELYTLLENFPEKEAEMFVSRLTGYKHYGKSIAQLAVLYKMTENDIILLLTGITHQMLSEITEAKERFPFLTSVIHDLPDYSGMTQSAKRTHQLIVRDFSISQVAELRNLKKNTIYDHLVEVALYDKQFPVNNYVNDDKYQTILHAAEQTKTNKLKTIKEMVNEDISYFQIRLALASAKNRQK
jgi:uncharacterized protein YpbB